MPSFVLTKSKRTTRHCKICFKEIKDYSLFNFFNNDNELCENCFHEFKAKFINFKIGTIEGLSIYNYDDFIRKLLYTFKGCYDIELKNVFLCRYLPYLKMKYRGYVVVPAPSSKIDDEKRGFNHVKEIYKSLGLPILDILEKNTVDKQSSKSKKKRLNIEKIIEGKNIEILNGKKVLIVDDIYTTGATIFKCIEIVKEARPKVIKVLVVAKTIDMIKRRKT